MSNACVSLDFARPWAMCDVMTHSRRGMVSMVAIFCWRERLCRRATYAIQVVPDILPKPMSPQRGLSLRRASMHSGFPFGNVTPGRSEGKPPRLARADSVREDTSGHLSPPFGRRNPPPPSPKKIQVAEPNKRRSCSKIASAGSVVLGCVHIAATKDMN